MKSLASLVVVLFLWHFLLGSLLSLDASVLHQWVAATHSLLLTGLFYFIYRNQSEIFKNSQGVKSAFYIVLSVHLGVLLGVSLMDSTEQILWVVDSQTIHVPGAQRVADFLMGKGFGERSSIYDRTYLAHLLAGVSFFLFGANQIASGIALMVAKLGAVYYLFLLAKELQSEKVAQLASTVYILLPTALFYSVTFYKEATVHLLVTMVSFYLIKVYRYGRWQDFLLLAFGLLFLGNERHYLVPCFAVAVGMVVILSRHISQKMKGLITLSVAFGGWVFLQYYWDIHWDSLFIAIGVYRDKYLAYADVSPINKQLPYPLAIIKLYFSPFFTVGKMSTYDGFASLITWGSFLYQVVAVGFVAYFFKGISRLKTNVVELSLLVTPMLLLLAVFGYVAPYNGRLRDSFISLICLGFISLSIFNPRNSRGE